MSIIRWTEADEAKEQQQTAAAAEPPVKVRMTGLVLPFKDVFFLVAQVLIAGFIVGTVAVAILWIVKTSAHNF